MRWIFRILGALAVFALIAFGLVAMIPAERIARLAADRLQAMTGRELVIEGGVTPRFWPVLGVATGPVSVSNAEWGDAAPLFAAEGLVIEINTSALLGGDLRVLGLRAERPRILLERGRDGRDNWVFEGSDAPGAATGTGTGQSLTLEDGLISNGTLRFVDHGTGTDITLDKLDLAVKVPDYSGPFSLTGSALLSGQPVSLALEGGAFSTFVEGRAVPLTLDARAGGATARFEGRGGWQPMAAEGALTADLSDLGALAALAGAARPDLPQGFGAERLAVSGRLTLDGAGGSYLRGARIEADGNLVTGDLDLRPGEARPRLAANLRAERLSLAGGSAGGGGAAASSAGWSTAPIDVSALGTLDAEISLVTGGIDLGILKSGETRLMLTIDRARAVFDIRQMAAYGGQVTGEFVVNGRGGLSVGGKLSLANIGMQALLQDLAGWNRLIAQGNLTFSFLGVGNSMDAIMRSLSGEGTLSLGRGELLGLDIAGMLTRLDTSYVGEGQRTIFDGVAGSFTIEGGNLTNSDLRLLAPYLTASGQGRIGIGTRDLDYRIRPTAFPGEDGTGGVMVPLRITGAWSDPTYRLDMESVARERMEAEARAAEERLRAEAAAAEARAKAELEARLQEELGIERAEGESLEEAAKRRAQEALTQEAGRLLEGLLGGN
ncbi:AsmA family protein [Pseudogemmobacter sonorensis]|uniref:AsmA family protein n=1 Tax=Pseudogemmobacter sonorensis TaxID=2989681 RepID=UPI0036CB7253